MIFGLNPGAWLFWANAVAIVVNVAVISSRRVSLLTVTSVLASAVAASLIWAMQGACVLPQDRVIEFRQGMSLCPGQSAKINIVIPQPPTVKVHPKAPAATGI